MFLLLGASGRLPALQAESKARDIRIEKLGLRCAEFGQESAATMLYLKASYCILEQKKEEEKDGVGWRRRKNIQRSMELQSEK